MNIDVTEQRLVVISDLHLGCPASTAAEELPRFVAALGAGGWSLCINGDAIDLLQFRLTDLVADMAAVLGPLRRFHAVGGRIRYVLGNHDLVLEHLLGQLPIEIAPFLNVRSGSSRIRIEHGHVHEPGFARAPGLYELGGRLARPFLLLSRDVYRGYARIQRALHRRRLRRDVDSYATYRAADSLFQRGFDAVVLGHTHLPEVTPRPGGLFVNGGDWLTTRTFVTIDAGAIALHRWPEDAGVLRPRVIEA